MSKDSPYMLYKSLESIYKSQKGQLYIASSLYEQMVLKFNKSILNNLINKAFLDNQFYIYSKDYHSYYNKYKNESCNLIIKNSYIICNTNSAKIELLKPLANYHLFACDFANRDYFWFDEIYC